MARLKLPSIQLIESSGKLASMNKLNGNFIGMLIMQLPIHLEWLYVNPYLASILDTKIWPAFHIRCVYSSELKT